MMPWGQPLAGAVFAATFVLLALGRIGGQAIPRGAAALAGGLATALLLGVSWRAVDLQVILLIVGLMALAAVAEEAGLFDGLLRRLAGLPPRLALWAMLALMAFASAALLNDAAVVVLVPAFLPTMRGLGLPPVRGVVLLAVAANVGSLLTPFGNPQNAVLARAAGLGVPDFLQAHGPTVLLGLALLGAASWRTKAAPPVADVALPTRPAPARARGWVAACVAGFLLLGLARPGWLALGTAAVACAALAWAGARMRLGRRADMAVVRSLDWNVVALFVGLYLLTAGLPEWAPTVDVPRLAGDVVRATSLVTALSNLVGNVPAMLALLRLDVGWTVAHAPFLVAVSTLGGTLLLTGSAASLLAADQARKAGVEVGFVAYLRHAVPWTLPLLAVAAWLTWPGGDA